MFDIVPVTSPRPTDCGATCLLMLLSYYGIEADLDELVIECKTRIIGCTGKDICVAARAHGLTDMVAWKSDAEDVLSIDRPAIIWWMYNHWVLFGGIDESGRVVIYNPDKGRYRISPGVFKSFYTGVALSNGMPEDMDTIPEYAP